MDILETCTGLMLEIQHYPEWFLKYYAEDLNNSMKEILAYSDSKIELICNSATEMEVHEKKLAMMRDSIKDWRKKFAKMKRQIEIEKGKLRDVSVNILLLGQDLQKQGYIFEKSATKPIGEIQDYGIFQDSVQSESHRLSVALRNLKDIPDRYRTLDRFSDVVEEALQGVRSEYIRRIGPYQDAFGEVPDIDIHAMETNTQTFAMEFKRAYAEKDMIRLDSLVESSKNLFPQLLLAVEYMNERLRSCSA